MEYKIYIAGGILTILIVALYWILVNRNSK